jgi:hypothetical protein
MELNLTASFHGALIMIDEIGNPVAFNTIKEDKDEYGS